MSLNGHTQDVNYWPSISDMFLVFFIMAMSIVITSSVSDEVGDKYLVDDVIREYDSLVWLVGDITDQDVSDLYYLKQNQELVDFDLVDPEKGNIRRPLLRCKIAKLLQLMDTTGFYRRSKHYQPEQKKLYTELLHLPRFANENGPEWAEYPFAINNNSNIESSYRTARNKYAQDKNNQDKEDIGYDEALRLLAFRVLYVGHSTLSKMDVASMAREVRMAFAGISHSRSTPVLMDTINELNKLTADKQREIDNLKKENNKFKRVNKHLKKMAAGGKGNKEKLDEASKEILELESEVQRLQQQLHDRPQVSQAELDQLRGLQEVLNNLTQHTVNSSPEKIAALIQQLIDVENTNLYTNNLQEADVLFALNGATPNVQDTGEKKLNTLVKTLSSQSSSDQQTAYEIIIVGHTDNTGDVYDNSMLGIRRALAIRNAIINRLKERTKDIRINEAMNIYSFGNTHVRFCCYSGSSLNPLEPTDKNTECAANRRVEVKLTRADKKKAEFIIKKSKVSPSY